jgi:hypothetical protein
MKTIIVTFMTCFFLPALSYATSQIPELLLYEGTTNDMYSTPLESYFSTDNPKPNVFFEHPPTTACWRFYVGTWKIEDDVLYLVALQRYPGNEVISLDRVNSKWTSPVKATWFTGTIRIGRGKVLMGGMGFSEKREIDIFLRIENGRILSTHLVDNRNQQGRGSSGSKRKRSVRVTGHA